MARYAATNEGKASIIDRKAFRFYRKRAKHRNIENTKTLTNWSKIVNRFYQKIGEKLVESEGGVFIKGLGYFTVIVYPKKVYSKTSYNKEGFSNFHTNNYVFMPTFVGFRKGYPLLNFWCMDRMFRTSVKRGIFKKITEEGMRYKTYVSTLYTLYSKDR